MSDLILNKNKKTIAIIFGGCSSEHDISCQSAYSVINHINTKLYNLIMLGITKSGEWLLYSGSTDKILNNTWVYEKSCIPAIISPNRKDHGVIILNEDFIEKIFIDGVFPILHGKNGEDGTVQGLIELSGIPLIGCGTLSSALCMDKKMAHNIVNQIGINTPKSVVIKKSFDIIELNGNILELKYPLFVKPVRSGSSLGITKVLRKDDLLKAVEYAFEHDNEVIIEENIDGFEVGCAVLGNDILTVGELDEIELSNGFFDYTEKYTLKTSKIHVPARINNSITKKIKESAIEIYKALGCKGFARVDLFLTKDEEIIFNEVNTIPGFTTHSRYPKMLECTGLSFAEVIGKIIKLGIN